MIFRYGSEEPPSYDLSLIKQSVEIYYGDDDKFTNPENMSSFVGEMKNADVKLHFKKGFGHETFLFGVDNYNFYQDIFNTEKNPRRGSLKLKKDIDEINATEF